MWKAEAMHPDETRGLNHRPDRRGPAQGVDPEYRITVSLAVTDAAGLWHAARDRLLAAPGGSEEMVEETIGSVDDPQVADCLALLCAPTQIAGCAVEDYWVNERQAAAPEDVPFA